MKKPNIPDHLFAYENIPLSHTVNIDGELTGDLYSYVFESVEVDLNTSLGDDYFLEVSEQDESLDTLPVPMNTFPIFCPREPAGPPAPPKDPPKPKPLPKLKEGPKTERDRQITKWRNGVFKRNNKHPELAELIRRFWEQASKPYEEKGFKVPWVRVPLEKYKKCDFSNIFFSFYSIGRAYWEVRFDPYKPLKGYGADTPTGISGGVGTAKGELTYSQYHDYGAKAHLLCGEIWITLDLGEIGKMRVKDVTFKNYHRNFKFAKLDTTQKGGSFKQVFIKWDKVPPRPSKVPSKYQPGETVEFDNK